MAMGQSVKFGSYIAYNINEGLTDPAHLCNLIRPFFVQLEHGSCKGLQVTLCNDRHNYVS